MEIWIREDDLGIYDIYFDTEFKIYKYKKRYLGWDKKYLENLEKEKEVKNENKKTSPDDILHSLRENSNL